MNKELLVNRDPYKLLLTYLGPL